VEPYKRQQAILALLQEAGEVKVEDLAVRFGVSPNTIRNDLNTMHAEGLLRRVRGGAIAPEQGRVNSDDFTARLNTNRTAKVRLAQWAADLVKDGDAIIFDASSTAYHLATFLQSRRNLTVTTNGLEVALLLAKNPSNKVMLAANIVSPHGLSLVGSLPPSLQDGFCASKCFISCSAFSVGQGLTERSVDEAAIKSQMIKQAQQIIALVDSSKFGRIDAARFAGLHQIDHLVTEDSIPTEQLTALRQVARFPITVVGTSAAETLAPLASVVGKSRYRIGFANMTERMTFTRQVRRSLENAAAQLDNIELLIRDNELDRRVALANVDWFVANGADLVIEFQIDALAGNVIMDKLKRAGIPVIAVDIPLPGATFYGADNYRAGYMAGEALGRWIKENWQGCLDLLMKLEAPRVGPSGQARLQGLHEGLESVIGPIAGEQVMALDSPVIIQEAEALIHDLLPSLPLESRIGIVAINDDAALGALAAFEKAERLCQVVAVGQNADQLGQAALRRPQFPFIGSTRYAPESYGSDLLDLALKILNGEVVPPAVYNQHVFITKENLDEYYPEAEEAMVPEESIVALEGAQKT
jgi:ribose transport system substrate-binding protein